MPAGLVTGVSQETSAPRRPRKADAPRLRAFSGTQDYDYDKSGVGRSPDHLLQESR